MNIKFLSILAIFFTFTLSGCSDDESDEDRIDRMKSLVHSVSKNFNSQWKEVDKNNDIVSYIHPDMIFQDEKKDWIRESVVLSDFVSNKHTKNFRSATSERVFDCQSWKYKDKAYFFNKSPMNRSQLKTEIVKAKLSKKQKDWRYPMSSSPNDRIMKYVCSYKDPEEKNISLDFDSQAIERVRKAAGN